MMRKTAVAIIMAVMAITEAHAGGYVISQSIRLRDDTTALSNENEVKCGIEMMPIYRFASVRDSDGVMLWLEDHAERFGHSLYAFRTSSSDGRMTIVIVETTPNGTGGIEAIFDISDSPAASTHLGRNVARLNSAMRMLERGEYASVESFIGDSPNVVAEPVAARLNFAIAAARCMCEGGHADLISAMDRGNRKTRQGRIFLEVRELGFDIFYRALRIG